MQTPLGGKDKEISQLRKELEMMRDYLDIADVIIVVIDADQRVSYINRKGCDILGYQRDDIIGKNWFDGFVPKRVGKNIKETFGKLITGETKPAEYYENPVVTKSSEEKLLFWHNTVLRDDGGRIVSTLSSGQDITDRRKAEVSIQKALERLRTDLKMGGGPVV